jgi:glycosyltransferase involved in cell wall biosynthesis
MADQDIRLDVVIPVYNEERTLPGSVARLRAFLEANCPYDWRIIVADNASTDRTLAIAGELAGGDGRVSAIHLDQKGRGRALRRAWLESDADVVAYMDVDLSTGLDALPALIDRLVHDGYDVAIGSRLTKGARVTRQWKRELTSRGYNLLIKLMFPHRSFADAQCGFKALTREATDRLVPLVANNEWFFDSELLLRAEQLGFRIAEVPVDWVEDLDSRVNVAKTAAEDIRGLVRVRLSPPWR